MFRKLSACIPLAVLLALGAATPADARQREKVPHPRLHAALYELRQAHKELTDAGGGFGGHRKQALSAMEDSISSIRQVLQIKGDDPNVLVRKAEHYRRFKTYPHLRQVLVDLKEARTELEEATSDFRGKKKDAIRSIDAAIKQVKLCMDHAEDR